MNESGIKPKRKIRYTWNDDTPRKDSHHGFWRRHKPRNKNDWLRLIKFCLVICYFFLCIPAGVLFFKGVDCLLKKSPANANLNFERIVFEYPITPFASASRVFLFINFIRYRVVYQQSGKIDFGFVRALPLINKLDLKKVDIYALLILFTAAYISLRRMMKNMGIRQTNLKWLKSSIILCLGFIVWATEVSSKGAAIPIIGNLFYIFWMKNLFVIYLFSACWSAIALFTTYGVLHLLINK